MLFEEFHSKNNQSAIWNKLHLLLKISRGGFLNKLEEVTASDGTSKIVKMFNEALKTKIFDEMN